MRFDPAGDGQVLGQRGALPAQDVGPVVHEALVFDEPSRPARPARKVGGREGAMAIRHG